MILLQKYGAISIGASETLGGMVLMSPTSIAYTGTSASIGSNGSVTFSAVSTLSLNGVFNTDYDNYLISVRDLNTVSNSWYVRMRSAGTDNSTASSYRSQEFSANNTSVTGSRTTDTFGVLASSATTIQNGFTANVYGPFLAQATAWRSVTMNGTSLARIRDYAVLHNQTTSYDGFTIYLATAGSSTGVLSVYGLVGT